MSDTEILRVNSITALFWGVLLGGAVISCDGDTDMPGAILDPRDEEQEWQLCESETGPKSCIESGFKHSLQGLSPVDGLMPFVDLKNAPGGGRYAMLTRVFDSGDSSPTIESGVFELARKNLSASELQETVAQQLALKDVPKFELMKRYVLDPEFEAELQELAQQGSSQPLQVFVRFKRLESLPLMRDLQRGIAYGLIKTRSDYYELRANLIESRKADTHAYVSPLLAKITQNGGGVKYACSMSECATVVASPDVILALADIPEIVRIDRDDAKMTEDANMDGVLIDQSFQATQFRAYTYLDNGTPYHFDGEDGANIFDLAFAITEFSFPFLYHVAYTEDNGVQGSRIRNHYYCDSVSCATPLVLPQDPANGVAHATGSLGAVMADLHDNQEPTIMTTTGRLERSSPAGESTAWVYKLSSLVSAGPVAWENMNDHSPPPVLVTSSLAADTDPYCNGMDSLSESADTILYENGIFHVKSAGNQGGTLTDCRVSGPGAAISTFTVGGYGPDSEAGVYSSLCEARVTDINANSSWGGSPTVYAEGRGRGIVDIVAPYWQFLRTTPVGYGWRNGTSIAAPSVASAALAYVDMYRNSFNSDIDDPGVLFANMLLMGDRATGYGSAKTSIGFSSIWGAGRIKMRMLGVPEGWDAPAIFISGSLCVDDGETVVLYDSPGSLSTDYDTLKAAIWWYDKSFVRGDRMDDVNLLVFRETATSTGSLVTSISPYDNMERVYHEDVGGMNIRVEIQGSGIVNPIGDDVGCGVNSQMVFVAFLIEDSDRDDAEGPTYDAGTCIGVGPD